MSSWTAQNYSDLRFKFENTNQAVISSSQILGRQITKNEIEAALNRNAQLFQKGSQFNVTTGIQ